MRSQSNLTVITNNAGVPTEFKLGTKNFQVIKILEFWRARTNWWRTGITTERKIWRVAAKSAQQEIVIEICYDSELAQWQLIRKLAQ
ncbi:MAG: hypothetical protein F2563_01370 [Actinobacteria bacterium]|jgi:hypothetical protein|uniref:Unannotated protein n=1 Tax=freshwater metagenome TaxID=449393 RepID=A0A6J6E3E3_9ZZZZ|nr:hypothetical protein [Actinomycetota bacterium]